MTEHKKKLLSKQVIVTILDCTEEEINGLLYKNKILLDDNYQMKIHDNGDVTIIARNVDRDDEE